MKKELKDEKEPEPGPSTSKQSTQSNGETGTGTGTGAVETKKPARKRARRRRHNPDAEECEWNKISRGSWNRPYSPFCSVHPNVFLKKSDVEKKLNMFRYGSEEQSEQAEGEIRKEEVWRKWCCLFEGRCIWKWMKWVMGLISAERQQSQDNQLQLARQVYHQGRGVPDQQNLSGLKVANHNWALWVDEFLLNSHYHWHRSFTNGIGNDKFLKFHPLWKRSENEPLFNSYTLRCVPFVLVPTVSCLLTSSIDKIRTHERGERAKSR